MNNRIILIVLLSFFMVSCNHKNRNKTVSNDFLSTEIPNNETINIQESLPKILAVSERMLKQEKLQNPIMIVFVIFYLIIQTNHYRKRLDTHYLSI
jgi:hypothetical protein